MTKQEDIKSLCTNYTLRELKNQSKRIKKGTVDKDAMISSHTIGMTAEELDRIIADDYNKEEYRQIRAERAYKEKLEDFEHELEEHKQSVHRCIQSLESLFREDAPFREIEVCQQSLGSCKWAEHICTKKIENYKQNGLVQEVDKDKKICQSSTMEKFIEALQGFDNLEMVIVELKAYDAELKAYGRNGTIEDITEYLDGVNGEADYEIDEIL